MVIMQNCVVSAFSLECTVTQLFGFSLDTSEYLQYWIVVANAQLTELATLGKCIHYLHCTLCKLCLHYVHLGPLSLQTLVPDVGQAGRKWEIQGIIGSSIKVMSSTEMIGW